jgi:thiol-disulfide isomerase/thioredoxin
MDFVRIEIGCETWLVNHVISLILVLGVTSVFGVIYSNSRGTVKPRHSARFTPTDLGASFGSRLTVVQFSSEFCIYCRPTKKLLEEVIIGVPDVKYIEIDVATNLDLVNRLNILSTPTTMIINSKGDEIGRVIGVPKRDQISDAISPIEM